MTAASDPDAFRRAMASFATGVVVVSCRHDGVDHAMTANAVASVSLRPPLVLVSVDRATRFWEAVHHEPRWGVSILAESAVAHAVWLSTPGRPLTGQLDDVPHHRGEHGMALLDDALAWLECRTYHRVPAGDHELLIGEVERASTGTGQRPLEYFRRHFHGIGDTLR